MSTPHFSAGPNGAVANTVYFVTDAQGCPVGESESELPRTFFPGVKLQVDMSAKRGEGQARPGGAYRSDLAVRNYPGHLAQPRQFPPRLRAAQETRGSLAHRRLLGTQQRATLQVVREVPLLEEMGAGGDAAVRFFTALASLAPESWRRLALADMASNVGLHEGRPDVPIDAARATPGGSGGKNYASASRKCDHVARWLEWRAVTDYARDPGESVPATTLDGRIYAAAMALCARSKMDPAADARIFGFFTEILGPSFSAEAFQSPVSQPGPSPAVWLGPIQSPTQLFSDPNRPIGPGMEL